LFVQDGTLYRQVNQSYRQHYDLLQNSGLYKELVSCGLLIPHEEVSLASPSQTAYKTLKPEVIPFVSYPYEWSFSQLQDAALATLQVQKLALVFGVSLKDASAYNMQFKAGKPVLIDTLSFERYAEGAPWVAYRQFCQHFLGPLALMSRVDVRLGQLFRVHIDGVPVDMANRLLSWQKYFSFGLLIHLHAHALAQRRFSAKPCATDLRQVSRSGLFGLIDSLETTVRKLRWQPPQTEWAKYYSNTNYEAAAFQEKAQIVAKWLDKMVPAPRCVWDFGANTGHFSRLANQRGSFTVSMDGDPGCVEMNYKECCRQGETQLLPLLVDMTNPSAALGWQNQERMSLLDRGPADLVLALAIVHHLAISNNLPLSKIAEFFSRCCKRLVIEFVPRTDLQVQKMLGTREDIFGGYTRQAFEHEFSQVFSLRERAPIVGSGRTLYLMERVA
jgi:ribosomal protein L11 methylase PrmA